MVKLRKGCTVHRVLQDAIVTAINDPSYSFSLPKLSDWESVVSSSVDEKQRLEFIGDAVMHLSVALYLYRLFPNAAPGLYTNIRSAVNTNTTFTHLMAKAGAYKLPSQSYSTKAAADSFEVIVAAFYMERGFADVHAWVQEQYAPLITAARESYDKCSKDSTRNLSLLSTKRHRSSFDPAKTPLLKKIRLSSGRNSPRSTLMAQRVIDRMKSKGKVKLCFPAKKPDLPLEIRPHGCELHTSEYEKSSPVVIDLTAESDSDDEDVAPSNSAQTSESIVKPPTLSRSRLLMLQSSGSKQIPDEHTTCHWLREQGTALRALPHRASGSPSSSSSSVTAMSSDHAIPIVPPVAFEFTRHTALSVPLGTGGMHPFGTHGNPIIIEDSEPES